VSAARGRLLPGARVSGRRSVRIAPGVAVVAAVAAAAPLMLAELGRRPLWADETVSVEAAKLPLRELGRYAYRVELNMVLYHGLLHAWRSLDTGEAFTRGLSVLFALATLPVLYALARRLADARVAAVSVLLLAVNVVYVGHAREARSYSLALLLVTAATFFFVRAVQDGRRGDWALYALAVALAVYAHLFAALVVPAQLLSLPALGPRPPWRRALGALAGAAVLLAPAAAAVAVHRQGAQIDWLGAPPARQLPGLILWFTDSRVLAALFLLAVAGAVVGAELDRRASLGTLWPVTLLVAWLVVPAAAAFAISYAKPVYLYRYFLPSLPALLVLVALGIVRLGRLWLVLPAAAVALTISTRTTVRCLPDCKVRYDDWRGAAAYLAARARPGDAVLFDPRDVRTPTVHYLGRRRDELALLYPERWALIGGPAPGARTLAGALGRADRRRRVWLVTWWLPQGDAPERLARRFRLVRDRAFAGNVRVRLYVR
jgi:mannosyltransferase